MIIKDILTVLRFHFFLSYFECIFLVYYVGQFFEMSFFYWGCACVCMHINAYIMLHLWASEDNFECWPSPYTLLKTGFSVFTSVLSRQLAQKLLRILRPLSSSISISPCNTEITDANWVPGFSRVP